MTKDRVNFELHELLHPAQAFDHPFEVVNDPDLTLNEKRAILASWASDACARTIRYEGITLTMLGLTIAVAMFATAAAVIWFAIASGPT